MVKTKNLAISMIAGLSKNVGGLDDTCLNFVNHLWIGFNRLANYLRGVNSHKSH